MRSKAEERQVYAVEGQAPPKRQLQVAASTSVIWRITGCFPPSVWPARPEPVSPTEEAADDVRNRAIPFATGRRLLPMAPLAYAAAAPPRSIDTLALRHYRSMTVGHLHKPIEIHATVLKSHPHIPILSPHPHKPILSPHPHTPNLLEDELIDLESSSSPSPVKSHEDGRSTPIINGQPPIPPAFMGGSVAPPKPLRVAHLSTSERNGKSFTPPGHESLYGGPEPMGPPERTYKVVFAGDAAVGKSTFIVRLCTGSFINNIASTLGQERFRSITKTYFRRADGVLLLYDVTSERSFLNVRQWIQSIDEACLTRVPLVLCGNKADLRDTAASQGRCIVSASNGERLARDYGAVFIETSCKNGAGVMDALVMLARQMVTNEDVEIQTSALKVTANDSKRSCCGSKKGE
ncbi:EF-hand calcium-binding domain-containing protein 4B-like [Penaeus vannamei]|uniref:EF-hand calcium-binding domain-containing protein 4B-like n=1 Tax=Penaeus vannamei TaxID=6689 RepID=UPI00387FA46F